MFRFFRQADSTDTGPFNKERQALSRVQATSWISEVYD